MVGVLLQLFNTKSVKLVPTIIDLMPPRPLKLSLGDEPSIEEMTEALKGMPNRKAVGPDGLPAELPKNRPGFAQCFHSVPVSVWVTGEVPQQWKYAMIKVLHRRRTELIATAT